MNPEILALLFGQAQPEAELLQPVAEYPAPLPYAVPRPDLEAPAEGASAPMDMPPPMLFRQSAMMPMRMPAVDYAPDDLDPYLVSTITNAARFMPSEQAVLGAGRGLAELQRQALQDAQAASNQANMLGYRQDALEARARAAAAPKPPKPPDPKTLRARIQTEQKMTDAVPDIVTANSVASRAFDIIDLAMQAQEASPGAVPNTGAFWRRAGATIAGLGNFGEDAQRLSRLNTQIKSLRLEGAPALEKLRPVSNYEAKIGVPMPETIKGGLAEVTESAEQYATNAIRSVMAALNNMRRTAPGAFNEFITNNPDFMNELLRNRRRVAEMRTKRMLQMGQEPTAEDLRRLEQEVLPDTILQPTADPFAEMLNASLQAPRAAAGMAMGLSVNESDVITSYSPRDNFRAELAQEFLAKYGGAVQRAAQDAGVPADLIMAIIDVESAFNPNAQSHVGAHGFMQLMPGTAQDVGVDRQVPEQNILGGARYIRRMLNEFGGRLDLALAAYNGGPGNLRARGLDISRMREETQRYVARVLQNLGIQYGR